MSLLQLFSTVVAVIIAYFCGSMLFGVWLGMRYRGIDIRQYGSGNAGATNAMRVLGPKLGVAVLLLDLLKGFLPTLLLPRVFDLPREGSTVPLLIGIAAVAGHVFSWMSNFRGGKGVATTVGVFLAVAPKVMLTVVAVSILLIGTTGYVSVVAVGAAAVLPVLLWWYGYHWAVIVAGAIICGIIIVRHKSNMLRLLAGNESKIWDKARPKSAPAGHSKRPSSPAADDDPPEVEAHPFDIGGRA